MDNSFIPILVVPAVPHEGGIRFFHREAQIDIDLNMANKLWKVLSFANGYNDLVSIAELANLPEGEVLEIFAELNAMELVVDSREQFWHFHRISNYPTTFNAELSQDEIKLYTESERLPVKVGKKMDFEIDKYSLLRVIREKRRSCRSFSKRKLTKNQIGSICHYGYSIKDHSVPSGGALYPLRIYVLVEEDQEDFMSGYYEYDTEQNCLVLFSEEIDLEQLKYCFNQEEMPFKSSVQIIIAADLERQTYKYANRGYRLTMIEAGHVAENISLYCAERGFGACEMGGVQDEPLKNELELVEPIWPLLTIAVGYPAGETDDIFDKIRYVEANVGENYAVKEVWANTFGGDGAFFGAAAIYEDNEGNVNYTGATSPCYADAVFKATIEGYERWFSGEVRVDFCGMATQVPGKWLDPRDFTPLTDEQAKKCGVKPFHENLRINWVKGVDWDDSEIYVPVDLAYYGHKSDENRIYFANSSGVAAHFDFKEAKRRAVIELIERDALMRSWYLQKSPPVVSEELLPIHVKKRIKYWENQGRKLVVLQVPSDYGNVFEVVIVSEKYPCFVSGAAATIGRRYISISETIIKAMREAEYSLSLAIRDSEEIILDWTGVATPLEHGKVYHCKENAEKIEWLWKRNEVIKSFAGELSFGDFDLFCKSALHLVTVDLSGADSDLKVVRVFSPYLVPINFGFDSAHYTHPAISGKVNTDSLIMPHYFA